MSLLSSDDDATDSAGSKRRARKQRVQLSDESTDASQSDSDEEFRASDNSSDDDYDDDEEEDDDDDSDYVGRRSAPTRRSARVAANSQRLVTTKAARRTRSMSTQSGRLVDTDEENSDASASDDNCREYRQRAGGSYDDDDDDDGDDDDDDVVVVKDEEEDADDDDDVQLVEDVLSVPTWTAEEVKSTVQKNWEMLSVLHFFAVFEPLLDLGDLTFNYDLVAQAWRRPSPNGYVCKLHSRLLKHAGERATLKNWFDVFQRRWQTENCRSVSVLDADSTSGAAADLSPAASYGELDLWQKVHVLKTTVDWVAMAVEPIREAAVSSVAHSFLGADNQQRSYWMWNADSSVIYTERRPVSKQTTSLQVLAATSSAPSGGKKAPPKSARSAAQQQGTLLSWLLPDSASSASTATDGPTVGSQDDPGYQWATIDVATVEQVELLLQELPRTAANLVLRSKIQKLVLKPLVDAEQCRLEEEERQKRLKTQAGIDLKNIIDTKRKRRTLLADRQNASDEDE